MTRKIKLARVTAPRIRNTGPTQTRLDPVEVAAALGAERLNASPGKDPGALSLAVLGSVLLRRSEKVRNLF